MDEDFDNQSPDEDIDLDNLEEMEQGDIVNDMPQDLFDEGENIGDISMEAEWREFSGDQESRKRSRVGMARAVDIEESLGLEIGGGGNLAKIQERIDRQNKTPEDIFKTLARKMIEKYHLPKETETDAARVMQRINSRNKKLKFKSPQAIVFALQTFDQDREIDKKKLKEVYETMANDEKISLFDLVRYARFVQDILYN